MYINKKQTKKLYTIRNVLARETNNNSNNRQKKNTGTSDSELFRFRSDIGECNIIYFYYKDRYYSGGVDLRLFTDVRSHSLSGM